MASITITIPDPKVQDVLDAFAARFARPNQVDNPDWEDDGSQTDPDAQGDPRYIANPETKAQFAKRMVAKFIRKVYVDRKTDEARVILDASVAAAAADITDVE